METSSDPLPHSDWLTHSTRLFSWGVISVLLVYLINNYLNLAHEWPGAGAIFSTASGGLGWLQTCFYLIGFAVTGHYVFRNPQTLRRDSLRINEINTFLIRAAFWVVVFIGVADMVVSFIRVEGFLPTVVGEELAKELGRPNFRGPYLHVPLVFAGIVTAIFTRTLGFTWLALLIVMAELAIVITRFVLSYEQAFMGDLVRYWYAALFLFASAYTLFEEGHVRVDVFYTNFRSRTKGFLNSIGCIFLGLSVCATIILIGTSGKSSILNSPVMNFEVSQSGYGMYVKYQMAAFLGVFAFTMAIQFASYLLESVADFRQDPGKRQPNTTSAQ
ncbi:MAG: TRAP transporter small permease subunit [SAR324 cluster bacterium]|nr:TRAP transporter small permease subunit [SAR324 cluster bacterium]